MIRMSLVAVLALVSVVARAQEASGGPPPVPATPAVAPVDPMAVDRTPADDGTLGLAPLDAGAAAPGGGATPDTYTVKPGDTLWDLSGRFLNNPWYWPKIWSYNPEIANPHWIYPGNLLKFFPSAEEAPTRVEPVPASPDLPIAEAAGAEEEEPEAPQELEDLSRADMKAPAPVEEAEAVAVAGPYKIGYAPARARFARRDTFVTPRELAESGSIRAAFEEKLMLSSLDRAYATFQNQADVKVGETYVVYKTERPIYHPTTKELFGYQSVVLGSAKVVAVEDRAATLVIAASLDAIERGAMLGPWTQKFFRPVDRAPNRRAVDARIIASQVDVVTQVGEHHVVFLDKGAADGVEEGNVFTVVRSGDQYGRDPLAPSWDGGLPVERVGDLLVVDVKDSASAALVTRSMRELLVGDRVEMRP
jgi:nucleoid-associated protein YgaU